jgi:hypothetical protein
MPAIMTCLEPSQELGDHRASDTLPTPVRAHVDAVLDAVPIARPCPKLAESAEAGDAGNIPRHDQRESMRGLGIEPSRAARRREFLFRIDGGRIADDFVVDRQNLRQIVAGRVVDHELVAHR